MIPDRGMLVGLLVASAIAGMAGWTANGWRYETKLSTLKSTHATATAKAATAHAEALAKANLRAPFIWRGFGWKDGAEDIERFRRALFDGQVKVVPSLLLRSAMERSVAIGMRAWEFIWHYGSSFHSS